MSTQAPANWSQLLEDATRKPGTMAACYRAFHNYSLGNVILAAWQCAARQIILGPIATYKKWQETGRQVRKGEKAITLCVPVMRTVREVNPDTGKEETKQVCSGFTYRSEWFVLAQTDGEDVELDAVPDWDADQALAALNIERSTEFDYPNGNAQGYATGRKVVLNPVAQHLMRTLIHEMAHILLGHTDMADLNQAPITLKELEAEAVAYLVCDTFGLDGAEESREYMQHWFGKDKDIPEENTQRIFRVAQKILDAGKVSASDKLTEVA